MKRRTVLALAALASVPMLSLQVWAQQSAAAPAVSSLPEIRRVYVAELVGAEADTFRELIIASLNSTRLFVMTDNPDRADAILKGAADDHAFTDTFDTQEGGARIRMAESRAAATREAGHLAGYRLPTMNRIIQESASTKPTQQSGYATKRATCCGRRRRKVPGQNSGARARMWLRKWPGS